MLQERTDRPTSVPLSIQRTELLHFYWFLINSGGFLKSKNSLLNLRAFPPGFIRNVSKGASNILDSEQLCVALLPGQLDIPGWCRCPNLKLWKGPQWLLKLDVARCGIPAANPALFTSAFVEWEDPWCLMTSLCSVCKISLSLPFSDVQYLLHDSKPQ